MINLKDLMLDTIEFNNENMDRDSTKKEPIDIVINHLDSEIIEYHKESGLVDELYNIETGLLDNIKDKIKTLFSISLGLFKKTVNNNIDSIEIIEDELQKDLRLIEERKKNMTKEELENKEKIDNMKIEEKLSDDERVVLQNLYENKDIKLITYLDNIISSFTNESTKGIENVKDEETYSKYVKGLVTKRNPYIYHMTDFISYAYGVKVEARKFDFNAGFDKSDHFTNITIKNITDKSITIQGHAPNRHVIENPYSGTYVTSHASNTIVFDLPKKENIRLSTRIDYDFLLKIRENLISILKGYRQLNIEKRLIDYEKKITNLKDGMYSRLTENIYKDELLVLNSIRNIDKQILSKLKADLKVYRTILKRLDIKQK